ncbi:MAG: nitroreductase family protein, partial [Deltaproteobacteria bacterium]
LSASECRALVVAIEAAHTLIAAHSPLTRSLYLVHGVESLAPGLYVPRGEGENLELALVALGDLRDEAQFLACLQSKASDCSLLLVAATLDSDLSRYEQAHLAAGMLGQSACFAAAQLGLAASGLGAFLDAPVRRFFGSYGIDTHGLHWVALGRARIEI